MRFEYLWFGLAIIAFQSMLMTSYNLITMVKEKIPESRRLRNQVGTIFFVISVVCALLASYGFSVMFLEDSHHHEVKK